MNQNTQQSLPLLTRNSCTCRSFSVALSLSLFHLHTHTHTQRLGNAPTPTALPVTLTPCSRTPPTATFGNHPPIVAVSASALCDPLGGSKRSLVVTCSILTVFARLWNGPNPSRPPSVLCAVHRSSRDPANHHHATCTDSPRLVSSPRGFQSFPMCPLW